MSSELRSLASDLVALDSRDFVSNVAIAVGWEGSPFPATWTPCGYRLARGLGRGEKGEEGSASFL